MALAGGGIFQVIRYVKEVPIVGNSLVIRLTGIIFITILLLLTYSSVITAFSTLFFAEDNEFIFVSPFHPGGVILGKLIQTSFYASWMSLLVLFPFIVAMGYIYKFPIYSYGVFTLATIFFFLTVAAASMSGVTLLVRIFPARKMRDFLIVGLVIGGTLLYIFFRILNIEQVLRPGQQILAAGYLSLFALPKTPYLPSYWMTKLVASFFSPGAGWMMSFFMLFLFALVFSAVYYFIAIKYFYDGWEKVKSQERKRYLPKGSFPRNPVLAKDFRTFVRDTGQWTQALIILALIVIYIVNIYKMPLDVPYLHYLVAYLNIGMIGFVLSSVGLRFTFSSISLEGRCFWILLSSPLNLRKLFRLKFMENFVPMEILGLTLVLGSNYILKPPLALNIVSTLVVAFMGLTLSLMGASMGCIYPRFDAAAPTEIETSWGGVLYMLASFFYILFLLIAIAVWARADFLSIVRGYGPDKVFVFIPALVIIVLNVSVALISYKRGIRALEEIEFQV
ncbi:MAG: hypothetical protein GX817_06715 [Elusimicrobia bacterium]|nr:hypothetical protein [Elusimicrobiota bacterium]